jgi:MFS family permease
VSESPAAPAEQHASPARRLLITVGLALLIVVLVLLAASFLPRWWAHRVSAQAGGNFTAGIALGLTYGFVFTIVPLAVLWWAFRRRRTVRTWTLMVAAALALALPNLLTLGIVLGTGGAAHAGERTLDVDAPGFRASVLVGTIVAGLVFLAGGFMLRSRRRDHREVQRLSAELRSRDEAAAGAAEQRPRPEHGSDG